MDCIIFPDNEITRKQQRIFLCVTAEKLMYFSGWINLSPIWKPWIRWKIPIQYILQSIPGLPIFYQRASIFSPSIADTKHLFMINLTISRYQSWPICLVICHDMSETSELKGGIDASWRITNPNEVELGVTSSGCQLLVSVAALEFKEKYQRKSSCSNCVCSMWHPRIVSSIHPLEISTRG